MLDSVNSRYFDFRPELVVEVTMVCDRACAGCYAPNLVSREPPESASRQHAGLFLGPEVLRERLSGLVSSLDRQLTSTSFRGGEPAMHPKLPALVGAAISFTRRLFVESHARWALPGARPGFDTGVIMRALARRNVTLKVSFDSMHETTAAELKALLEHLDRQRVSWLVAITEPDGERFEARRALCDWVPDSKIVHHRKAARAGDLYTPPFGVIRPDGSLLRSLSTRRAF